MNTISNCHIVCQCSGCVQSRTECKCNIGGQCGATAADKTVKVPVIVTQAQNQQNPTTIQVIGTVTLDTINYQYFVQSFNSARQQHQIEE